MLSIRLNCIFAWSWLGLSVLASAQEEAPKRDDPLAASQKQVADQLERLEILLLRSADIEAVDNPTRAALLQQAAQLSKQSQLSDLLEEASQNLQSNQLSLALDQQKASRDALKKLLELLQSENREKRVREDREKIRRWIDEADRLLRLQSSLRGRTEGGQEFDRATDDQKRLADKAAQIAQELDGQDRSPTDSSASNPPNLPAKSTNTSSPSSDSQSDRSSQPEKSSASESPATEKPAGEASDGETPSNESKSGQQNPAGTEKSNESPSQDSQSKDSKSNDAQPEGAPSGQSQPGETRPDSKTPTQNPAQGDSTEGQSSDQSNSSPSESSADDQSEKQQSPPQRAQQQLRQAQQRMQEAQQALKEAERAGAVEKQRQAEENLKQAIQHLEEILKQLREEEIKRSLETLNTRLRRMLDWQTKILEETKRLQEISGEQPDRQILARSSTLAREQQKVSAEGERALLLLQEEGSSAAFPEALIQVNRDAVSVTSLLDAGDVGPINVLIQSDIVQSLEEMVEAIDKVKREKEEQKQQQQQPGQGGPMNSEEEPLINKLAELRLIRTLQLRVNKRTTTLSQMLENPADPVGQAQADELKDQLRELSHRQQSIEGVTRQIAREE